MPLSVLTGPLAAAGFREGCLDRQERGGQPDKSLREEICSVERHRRPTKNAMNGQDDSAASSVRWLPRCLFIQTIPVLGGLGKSLQAGKRSPTALERVFAQPTMSKQRRCIDSTGRIKDCENSER
jgi:hypothetical protein